MTGQLSSAKNLVEQLIAGFEVLSEEYRQLFSRHKNLEAKLSVAKDQASFPIFCNHKTILPHYMMILFSSRSVTAPQL